MSSEDDPEPAVPQSKISQALDLIDDEAFGYGFEIADIFVERINNAMALRVMFKGSYVLEEWEMPSLDEMPVHGFESDEAQRSFLKEKFGLA